MAIGGTFRFIPRRDNPANTTHRSNVGPMLARRLQRRPNIGPILDRCVAFAGKCYLSAGYVTLTCA